MHGLSASDCSLVDDGPEHWAEVVCGSLGPLFFEIRFGNGTEWAIYGHMLFLVEEEVATLLGNHALAMIGW